MSWLDPPGPLSNPGRVAARRAGTSATAALRAGAALSPRGEFNIVIAGLAVAAGVNPRLGPLAAAYVLILAVAGPLIARAVEPLARRARRDRRRSEAKKLPLISGRRSGGGGGGGLWCWHGCGDRQGLSDVAGHRVRRDGLRPALSLVVGLLIVAAALGGPHAATDSRDTAGSPSGVLAAGASPGVLAAGVRPDPRLGAGRPTMGLFAHGLTVAMAGLLPGPAAPQPLAGVVRRSVAGPLSGDVVLLHRGRAPPGL